MRKLYPFFIFISLLMLSNESKALVSSVDSVLINEKNYIKAVSKLRDLPIEHLTSKLNTNTNHLNKCKITNALCWYYFDSSPPKAMEYAKLQMSIAEKINHPEAIIAAYDNLAYLFYGFSDNENAVEYMLKALKAKEKVNDVEGVAVSISGLASTYYEMNNYELALSYFNQVYDHFKKQDQKDKLAATLVNIGLCYGGMGDVDKGLENYFKAIDIYNEIGLELNTGAVYYNIGSIYFKNKKNYKEAIHYFEISAELSEKNKDISTLSLVYSDLAEVYSLQNNFTKALFYGKKAVQKANLLESKKNILIANKSLAVAFYNNKNYELAYHHFKVAFDLKDTIYNETSSNQIAEMQTKYDTEKKEAENKLLIAEKQIDKIELDKKSSQQKMLLGGLIMALLIVGYVGYSLNQKKKTNKLLNIKNDEISLKNNIIEEKNKDITDSINYAQRIQNAILPEIDILKNNFDSFIYYQPKDIVSGDFYWIKEMGDRLYFSVVDCTGHGVPGAFMSIIGYNSLNRIIDDYNITETGLILDKLNELVTASVGNKSTEEIAIRDGMDLSICCVDRATNILEYSGANNSLYLLRGSNFSLPNFEPILSNDEVNFYEIKPDKMAVGGGLNKCSYRTHQVKLEKGDSLYLFSDGYADQFGGKDGKKFMYKRFKKMILDINHEPMDKQLTIVDQTMKEWMGNREQLDDICLMGVKI